MVYLFCHKNNLDKGETMKCQKSTEDCKLELKFFEDGDVLEFCTVCDFKYLHESKNIENNHLNPYKKEN